MSAVQSVVLSFGFAGSLFAYMAFKLNDSEQPIFQILGVLFFNVTLLFCLGLMWAASQIAENNTLTYLADGIVPFITILTWLFIIVIVLLFVKFVWMMIQYMMELFKSSSDPRKRRGGGIM